MKALFAAFALLFPIVAGAHAFGVSYEATIEGVHVDIGYSSPAPEAGEAVIFDFNLPADETDERYTDVWLRIETADGSVKLATAIHNAEFGGPRMSYVFPEAGEYVLSARYENEGDELLTASWPITVIPASGQDSGPPWYVILLAGLLLGALASFVLARIIKTGRV